MIERLFTFLLLLISYSAFSQLQPSSFAMKSKISQSALKDAKRIMKKLNYCIRNNLKKDGKIVFYIEPKYDDLQAAFEYKPYDLVSTSNYDSLRFYTKSRIWFTKGLDSILSGLKDTSLKIFIKSKSIMVHELVHYLQCGNNYHTYKAHRGGYTDSDEFIKDMREYLNIPNEFESWSVESYYFLESYNNLKLKKIMKSNNTLRRKCELLINLYRLIDVPTNPSVF